MDIDPEGEPSHHEQVSPLAPETGTVTTVTVPRDRMRAGMPLLSCSAS